LLLITISSLLPAIVTPPVPEILKPAFSLVEEPVPLVLIVAELFSTESTVTSTSVLTVI
jgi:hypothetical protein